MNKSVCPRCLDPMNKSDDGQYCPRCAGRLLLESTLAEVDGDQPDPLPAAVRVGKYELGAELGRGAMGVVYRARQPGLKRDVALKVILASRFAGESARKRFLAEAELAAQLDHPNIVPIYEVGETPDGPFYAMKLIEGGTLAERMQKSEGGRQNQGGSLLHSEFFLLPFIKIARAVHHAHQRGVLHRDLKPGNILLDAQGEPHVTDFGLARQLGVESSLTVSGSSLGTPAYMAPEQARGEKTVTTASDVWSLGAILYHLLAGRPPFTGDTAIEVMRKVMEEEPVPPGRFTKDDLRMTSGQHGSRIHRKSYIVNSDLETICLKCLEKHPARRYGSALALAEDLERWLKHEPILARPSTAVERVTKWAQRRPAIAALTALAGVLVIVAITGITWQWRRAERNARAERASSQKARDQLWHSLLAQARAGRLSGQFGSKRAGLDAIATAAQIRPAPELRDEAIAHLALFDLQPDAQLHRQTNYLGNPCFNADGTLGADMDASAGTLRVFRTVDDVEVARLPVPQGSFNPRFSSLGQHLLVTRLGGLILVNAHTGAERFRLHNVRRARFSPDDTMLAVVGRDNVIRFHDAGTGQALPFQLTPSAPEEDLVWSPDGQMLALALGNKVEIWDWRKGRRMEPLPHDASILRLAWERECLAIGDEHGGLQLWNSRTKKSRRLRGHDDRIDRMHINGAGTVLASSSLDGTSRFWSTATGKLLLTTDRGLVYQFSRDGSRVCYRTPGGWGVWQVDAPRAYRLLSVGDQRTSLVSTADLSPDNRALLLASAGSSLLLMDLASERITKFPFRDLRVAWFMPGGRTIFTSGYDQGMALRSLDISTNSAGESAAQLGAARTVPGVAWKDSDSAGLSDDGRMAGTKVSSREVVFVDLEQTNRIVRLTGAREACRPTFSADHRWVVTASENGGGPCLWEADTGKFVRQLHPHPDNGGAQFSPDGRVLVTSDPSGVRFYDASTWNVIRHLPAAHGTPLAGSAAFTPDSRLVAFTIGKRELRLANPRTGEVLAKLTSPEPRPINSLRFSRDGRTLVVATGTDVVDLWDIGRIEEELEKIGLGLPR